MGITCVCVCVCVCVYVCERVYEREMEREKEAQNGYKFLLLSLSGPAEKIWSLNYYNKAFFFNPKSQSF